MITSPLTISGWDFLSEGHKISLLGSVVCCSETVLEKGWPLINEAGLREIAEAKGNYTHIRLGPFINETDHGFEAYNSDGSWNQEFWTRAEGAVSLGQALGIYVEVDLIDSWALKVGRNYFGSCDVVAVEPTEEMKVFVRKAVEVLGKYPNTLWQISNESGVWPCGRVLKPRWENGIAEVVLATERALGYPHHLIGTNCGGDHPEIQNSALMDYWNVHEDRSVVAEGSRPLVVNEWGGFLTPAEWAAEARKAREHRTIFHLWRAESWTKDDEKEALRLLKEIQSE